MYHFVYYICILYYTYTLLQLIYSGMRRMRILLVYVTIIMYKYLRFRSGSGQLTVLIYGEFYMINCLIILTTIHWYMSEYSVLYFTISHIHSV